MAEVNEIFTRIQLKYDSYIAWKTNNPALLAGEVAIAKLVNENVTIPTDETKNAPVLFKVGPGKFNDLPWVSGLAADVYAWAKKATPDWTDFPALPITVIDNGTGKFVTDFTYADNMLTITRSDVNWNDVQNKPEFDNIYKKLQTAVSEEGSTSKTITKVEQDAQGKVTVTYGDIAFPEVTIPNITVTDDTTAEVPTTETVNVYKNLTANGQTLTEELVEVATKKAVDDALAAAKDYADKKPHENTAHTHTAGAGIKVTGNGGIDGEVKHDLNVAFELVDKTIKLYDKDDATKTAIAELDATQFIADGMLASVTADQANNKLVFEWNIDAGVTKTEVELSSIADIYTGVTNTETATTVKNTNEIEVTLVNKGVTEAKLEQNVQDALALARTALQEHQSLENYKTKQTAKNYDGTTAKTVTNVKQNANGEVEVTYADIAFPAAPTASGAATIATVADDVVTLKAGAVLNENHTLANNANADITLAKIAKTGSIYDVAEGYNVSTGTDGVKYLVFNCGSSTTVI